MDALKVSWNFYILMATSGNQKKCQKNPTTQTPANKPNLAPNIRAHIHAPAVTWVSTNTLIIHLGGRKPEWSDVL